MGFSADKSDRQASWLEQQR